MKAQIFILLFCIAPLSLFSQAARKDYYQLGRYQIYPERRYVMTERAAGGTNYDDEGNAYHWDGTITAVDPLIDYDKTTLYFIGNNIIFEEYLNPRVDMSSLKIFKTGFDRYYNIVCADKKYIYHDIFKNEDEEDEDKNENIDKNNRVSGKKYLGSRIYKGKNGQLYYFDLQNDYLERLAADSPLDLSTLKFACNRFFYDKNGFYQLGEDYSNDEDYNSYIHPKLLDSSGGNMIMPVIRNEYIIYGTSVYAKSDYTKQLNLSPDKIRCFDIYYDKTLLTDGTASYYRNEEIQQEEFKQTKDWVQIGAYGSFILILDDETKTIHFPSKKKSYNFQKQSNTCLIRDNEGYLLIDTKNGLNPTAWKITRYEDVQIFNFETKEYESLDINRYRFVGNELYVYKDILYSNNCSPVVERDEIDVDRLVPFYYEGKKTEYYTDGKVLLYHGNRTGYKSTGNEYSEIYYENRIVRNVDFSTLKAISQDIMIDKDYIYNGSYEGVEVIPIKKLGLRIVMYTED